MSRKPRKPICKPSIMPQAAMAQFNLFEGEILRRNPYMLAERLFTSGALLQGQAVTLALTDGDFTGECIYRGVDARTEATRIVRDIWSLTLVENIQRNKQTQCPCCARDVPCGAAFPNCRCPQSYQ